MTFCVDRPKLSGPGEAFDRFITSLDEMDQLLTQSSLTRALNYSDIEAARSKNRQVVIQSVEGGHFIEGKLERIKIAYDRGLRHLGLMHDEQSSPAIGDIYTSPAEFGGLTSLGVDIIKECNRLGILVDVAHCSNEAVNQAIRASSKPLLVSHTGLDSQLGSDQKMAQMMMPRLINKRQARIVAEAGGAIGVWTHLAATPLEYAKNVRALVDVVGTDHVCIGTDTKMSSPSNNQNRFGKNTNESWGGSGTGFFYSVVEAMLSVGFSESEILQIGGNNYCRLFKAGTGL